MHARGTTVGFVGVGAISSAMVEALLGGPNADYLDVVLSPRSSSRSGNLAAKHTRVLIATDNQAVVDASDVVILAVLPSQVESVCSTLVFPPGQIVVGIPAGWPPSRLGPLVAPAKTVCQMIPLPMIALGTGPLVLYPYLPAVSNLFAGCGRLVVLEYEDDIPTLSCASAVMSSFFATQARIIDWITQHGITGDVAANYVTTLMHGLARQGLQLHPYTAELISKHETPGGLNAFLRGALESDGVFDTLASRLDEMETRLRS